MRSVINLALPLFSFTFISTTISTSMYAAGPTAPHPFHVQGQWHLGGKGGWSFLVLDAHSHRLFIPRTNRVTVVDTTTGKLVGEVEDMVNIRGIALDDSGKYAYVTDVTDGNAGFVRVFDRLTLKAVTSVPTEAIPNAIVFDPISRSIFTFNSRGHSVTVIDANNNQVTATVPLTSRPGPAVADGSGHIFVVLPAVGQIDRIDALTKEVTATLPLAPCTGPSGLAIDSARHQLFTSCEDHKLVMVDADTGRVFAIADAPANPGDIDFDPSRKLLFVTDTTGALTILHSETVLKFSKVQQVATQPNARTMAVDHDNARAYLVTAKYGESTGPAVSEELRYRPTPIPDTFSVIIVGH